MPSAEVEFGNLGKIEIITIGKLTNRLRWGITMKCISTYYGKC